MTPDIALALGILAASVAFLITEWVPMEVVALLAMGAVAITGLVSPAEALAGFSSPAVVTVGAGFILSGVLARTGVANIIGRQIMKVLWDSLGLRVLVIKRGDGTVRLPSPEDMLRADDRLVVEGRRADLEVLQGLARLEIERRSLPDIQSETVGLVEMILSPHTTLAGKTLRQLHFREKFGLTVWAIWRQGRVQFENLRDLAFNFGDALLLHGPRANLDMLGREPDFIVLTQSAQEQPRLNKAKLSTCIMAAVMLPVILGWVPIYIATVVGAALMVLTRCRTMDEA